MTKIDKYLQGIGGEWGQNVNVGIYCSLSLRDLLLDLDSQDGMGWHPHSNEKPEKPQFLSNRSVAWPGSTSQRCKIHL